MQLLSAAILLLLCSVPHQALLPAVGLAEPVPALSTAVHTGALDKLEVTAMQAEGAPDVASVVTGALQAAQSLVELVRVLSSIGDLANQNVLPSA